jgi:hypothetical protein
VVACCLVEFYPAIYCNLAVADESKNCSNGGGEYEQNHGSVALTVSPVLAPVLFAFSQKSRSRTPFRAVSGVLGDPNIPNLVNSEDISLKMEREITEPTHKKIPSRISPLVQQKRDYSAERDQERSATIDLIDRNVFYRQDACAADRELANPCPSSFVTRL